MTDITLVTSLSRRFQLKFKLKISYRHDISHKTFQNVPECSSWSSSWKSVKDITLVTSLSFRKVHEVHAGLWAWMQLHKLAYSYISLHIVTKACMQVYELACSSLSLHEVPWTCIQFHDLLCSSFLCLSSSQEFRSACSFKILFKLSFKLSIRLSFRHSFKDLLPSNGISPPPPVLYFNGVWHCMTIGVVSYQIMQMKKINKIILTKIPYTIGVILAHYHLTAVKTIAWKSTSNSWKCKLNLFFFFNHSINCLWSIVGNPLCSKRLGQNSLAELPIFSFFNNSSPNQSFFSSPKPTHPKTQLNFAHSPLLSSSHSSAISMSIPNQFNSTLLRESSRESLRERAWERELERESSGKSSRESSRESSR